MSLEISLAHVVECSKIRADVIKVERGGRKTGTIISNDKCLCWHAGYSSRVTTRLSWRLFSSLQVFEYKLQLSG